MRRKFGTVIDQDQLTELKLVAAKERKKLADVLAEAISQYLRGKRGSMVEKTRGAIPAPPGLVRGIRKDEDGPYEP